MPDDILLFSEDGETWLTPRDWLRMMHRAHPESFRDATALPDPAALVSEREEAKQWRAGRGQGVLARTSPLMAERRKQG